MTANQLSVVAGVLLSVAFSYIPKLNTWFAALSPEYKRLIMLGLMVVVGLGAYGFSCLGWFNIAVTCDKAGALALVEAFVAAAIANQTAYQLTPQTKAVKAVKAAQA